MGDKQSALGALRGELGRWETMLAALSEGQIAAPQLDDGWSIKDVVAHLWAWQLRSIARLEAALHSREPDYPDWPEHLDPEIEEQPHELNAWIFDQYHDLPWPEVYRRWSSGFRRLIELGEALTEEQLDTIYPWLDGHRLIAVLDGTHEHHQEHWGWLPATG